MFDNSDLVVGNEWPGFKGIDNNAIVTNDVWRTLECSYEDDEVFEKRAKTICAGAEWEKHEVSFPDMPADSSD